MAEPAPFQELVTLDNGVVLPADVAEALALVDDPGALLNAIFTDPAQALKAIANIGADMDQQTREEGQKTVVTAVIVGQIASQAAMGVAMQRRKQ